jgi:glycosyltransferase involved in cell wall biosynthesis
MQANTPVLSICVPSRNRQFYFQATIKALTASLRSDVEFVFVDNSDDPSVMDSFITPYLADPRIRYVRTGAAIRSMLDNWQTAIEASTGRWVSFIGDDDHADPDIAGVILKIEAAKPDVEAIDWAKLFYSWPDGEIAATGQGVPLGTEIHDVPRQLLTERAFRWQDATHVIVSGFSIYHGAVSRPLINRIAARYGGRFFEFPVVDYEAVFKVIMNGKSFVHCSRPLSVLGVCALSNSAALKDLKDQEKKQDEFDRELDKPIDQLPCFNDYPFKSRFGVIACIGMAHRWFEDRHGITFSGFEENFTRACQAQCNGIPTREDYDLTTARYRAAFANWKRGKYQKLFRPLYTEPTNSINFSGVHKSQLYVSADNEPSRTCAGYYDLVSAALTPVSELEANITKYVVADQKQRKQA